MKCINALPSCNSVAALCAPLCTAVAQQTRQLRCCALTAAPCTAQIENEFGFLGPNEPYLRHLLASARAALGDDALIYTTDPPPNIQKGSLAGGDVYSCAPCPAADPGCWLVHVEAAARHKQRLSDGERHAERQLTSSRQMTTAVHFSANNLRRLPSAHINDVTQSHEG